MDNEKRAILAIALSILVLFIYQYYFAPAPQRDGQPKTVPEQLKPAEAPPPSPEPAKPVAKKGLAVPKPQTMESPKYPEKEISIATDLYTAIFSTRGACFKSLRLHRYKDTIESPAVMKLIGKLFSSQRGDNYAEKPQDKELILVKNPRHWPLRVTFIDADGNTADTEDYTSDSESLMPKRQEAGQVLTLRQNSNLGLAFEKKFIFRQDKYGIDFNFTIFNQSQDTIQGNALVEWTNPYVAEGGGGGFFSGGNQTVSRFVYYINGKVEKIEVKKLTEQKTLEGEILWTSFEEKYFTASIIPREENPHQVHVGKLDQDLVASQLHYPVISLKPGEKKSYTFSLYLGPRDINILRAQDAKLEKTIEFGFFDIIAKPLLLSLKFFYQFLGNYGLAIIVLTVFIKIIFWPLTHKSYQSMKDMQKLQPEMAKLKEKYKDKKEELNREIMGLYKKYKVNPLGGCLPMLLQIPVFIALYRVLLDSIELRHANFISFWINDLSAKDPTYLSPIIMGASMFMQQKMTPTSADPAQAKMMLFMPIVFTFMFLSFPSGLVIYWLINNVLSIAQQLYINKQSQDVGGSKWIPPKSKPKPSKKLSQ